MMKKLFFLLFVYVIFVPSSAFAYERLNPAGPMPIKNQMPMYLFWYFFPQEKAGVTEQKKFAAVFDYTVSNIIVDKVTTPTEEFIVKMDMEVNRYNLNLKYGPLENLEFGLEIPYLVMSKGYLDGFIEGFEKSVGAKSVGARNNAEKRQFTYDIRHNDTRLIYLTSPASGLGDIAFTAKYMLLDDMEYLPRASVRGGVKFPTASKNKYLGSGKFDAGVGILLDKSFSRLFTYFNFNTVFINKPDFLDELKMDHYIISGMLGLEYCFTEKFSSIIQGTFHSTPYPKTGTFPLDNTAGEAALGLNYQFTANSNWHIAVVENIYADSTPDATFQLGGKVKF